MNEIKDIKDLKDINATEDPSGHPPKKSYFKGSAPEGSRHLRRYVERCAEAGEPMISMTALPTFGCEYDKAPLPVLVHYGSRPLFRFKLPGADWNVELMMKDFKRGLIRADSGWSCGEIHRYDVVFGTRQGTFLHNFGG